MGNNCPSQSAQPFGGKLNDIMRISERKGSAIVSPFCTRLGGAGLRSLHDPGCRCLPEGQLSTDSDPTLRYCDYRTSVMLLAVAPIVSTFIFQSQRCRAKTCPEFDFGEFRS